MDYSHSYSAVQYTIRLLDRVVYDSWVYTPGKKKMTPPARIFTLCGQLAFILGGHFHDLEDGSKGKVWHYVPQALNGHRLQIVTRDCRKVISATISNFHLKPARNEAKC